MGNYNHQSLGVPYILQPPCTWTVGPRPPGNLRVATVWSLACLRAYATWQSQDSNSVLLMALRAPVTLPPKLQKVEDVAVRLENKLEQSNQNKTPKPNATYASQRGLGEKCLAWKRKCFSKLRKGKGQASRVQMGMLTTFPRVTQWFRNG